MRIFAKNPYLLAIILSLSLVAWLASGQFNKASASREVAEKTPSNLSKPSPLEVRVREQQAEKTTRELVLTGHTAPVRVTKLRAEIEARVIELPVERGSRVKQGDIIAKLAINDRQHRITEAQALVKQYENDYAAKKDLANKGFQAQLNLTEVLASIESAKTQLKQAQIALENTVIRAPFDGMLETRPLEVGDYVSAGDMVAEVIDESSFLILTEVTERERMQLKVGMPATAVLITGEQITGKIRLAALQATTATRTFPLEIEVPNADKQLIAGVTATLQIPTDTVMAHKVSSALLALDDAGVLGVKTVDEKNQVVFYPAKFARANTDGIWLTGLPEKLRFITVGQGFVRAGDEVKPIPESSISTL
ncbi:efflux RND transporter periplasmic adaptor subunit [Beggiatoa leptomitoformis]|uniref:Efflux RND transporter periplasmic adaptor subunit n=1 Tax=Beggiatoa leptomitoformis TaxID=288004 RepID=A0A2N9YES3_9GAMM|nr:efflux RND transporter periplasmic adaptor subunit [Beggiatoa leptomitoformis]ALG68660.1 efflux RND transporter periplasmic adaptor subunit [Beggiatoa leptomitoformis]AUI68988.1 efflux RND transporter periplasmic adaptor subunit [Beggiatoa leptomitoformis]